MQSSELPFASCTSLGNSERDLPPNDVFLLSEDSKALFERVDLNLKGARSHDASDQMCGCRRWVCSPLRVESF